VDALDDPECGTGGERAVSTDTADRFYGTIVAGLGDDLDAYFAQVLSTDPRFARAYYRLRAAEPRPLCINGHEYARRQRARRGRKR
jgi:hypothetical protein